MDETTTRGAGRARAPSARRRWVLFLLSSAPMAAILILLAWSVVRADGNPGGFLVNSEPGEESVVVRQAPAFALTPLDGGPVIDNEALQGKVVMVDFWASWCPPCRAEAADLAQVYREYEGRPVEFVGVAIWDDPSDVLRHLDRFGVTYPNAIDDRGTVAIDYGVRGLPEKFFLDRQGNVLKKFIGQIQPNALRELLDELLLTP